MSALASARCQRWRRARPSSAGSSSAATSVASNCAQINAGASAGWIPAKVLEQARAKVTAGLANEVLDVNQ